MRENIREWIKAVLTAAVAALIILQFVLPTAVSGVSMEPSFEDRDYVLVSRQAYLGSRAPERGDVVVFRSRLRDEKGIPKKLIKRVIAVSGDRILIENGSVYINGKKLSEPYLKDDITNEEVGPVTIPEGRIFCMGDNRLESTDSRFLEVGMIDEKDVIGRVFFRVFPFDQFGKIGRRQ